MLYLTVQLQLQLGVQILPHLDPVVHSSRHLLEVKDVVARWTVSVCVESELVTTKT